MEAKSALIGTYRAVELNSEAAVNYNVTVIIHPRNSELNYSFGLNESFNDSGLYIFGSLLKNGLDRFKYLSHRLVELALAGVSRLNARHKIV